MEGLKLRIIRKIQSWVKPFFDYPNGVKVSFWATGIHHVTCEGKNIIPEFCGFSDKTSLGYRTTLGTNNFFGGKVEIGKYCQVGRDVAFHPTNHPISYLTTYVNNELFAGELKTLKTEAPIEVGHDVWIGHGVIILAGVKVGNGAILAAGSVVTKTVEPYAIVAGNPAREIRKRFSEDTIAKVQAMRWWDKSDEELERMKSTFFKDLTDPEQKEL